MWQGAGNDKSLAAQTAMRQDQASGAIQSSLVGGIDTSLRLRAASATSHKGEGQAGHKLGSTPRCASRRTLRMIAFLQTPSVFIACEASVFTGVPSQSSPASPRIADRTRVVPSVPGTKYNSAGCPICMIHNAAMVTFSPTK